MHSQVYINTETQNIALDLVDNDEVHIDPLHRPAKFLLDGIPEDPISWLIVSLGEGCYEFCMMLQKTSQTQLPFGWAVHSLYFWAELLLENLSGMIQVRYCVQLGDVSVVVQKLFQWQLVPVSLSLGLQADILELEREFHCQETEREMWLLAVSVHHAKMVHF